MDGAVLLSVPFDVTHAAVPAVDAACGAVSS
jgi:hypothetical protein